MPMVPLGPWRPDQGIYEAGEARNCIRMAGGYRPFSSLTDFNAGLLPGVPTALIAVRDSNGTMSVIAGDNTALYKLNAATMGWDVIGGPYLTGTGRWRQVQWGDELVMTNLSDPMQVIDIAAGTPAAVLSVDAPKARFIAAAGPYLVVGDTWDAVDGFKPNRLRWSGIEDIRAWVPDPETTADFQDVPDVGNLKGLTGGRQLVCLFEEGVVIGSILGAPKAFRFDRVEGAQGCLEANSVLQHRARTYYLSRDGFQMFDGQRSQPIGWSKINRWFFDDALFGSLSRMSVTVDRQQKVIIWLYCGSGSDGVTPNHALLYNYDDNEFSWADVRAQLLGVFATPAYTVDNIDGLAPGGSVDLLPAPPDDPFYSGGVPITGAVVDRKLHALTGAPMTAIIETPFLEISPGRRSLLTEVRQVTEGMGAQQCQPITLDGVTTNPRVWPVVAMNKFGFCPVRAEGRYHRIRTIIGGGWKAVYGLDIMAKPLGRR